MQQNQEMGDHDGHDGHEGEGEGEEEDEDDDKMLIDIDELDEENKEILL